MVLGALVVGGTVVVGTVEERVTSGGSEEFSIEELRNERMFARVAAWTSWTEAFR